MHTANLELSPEEAIQLQTAVSQRITRIEDSLKTQVGEGVFAADREAHLKTTLGALRGLSLKLQELYY